LALRGAVIVRRVGRGVRILLQADALQECPARKSGIDGLLQRAAFGIRAGNFADHAAKGDDAAHDILRNLAGDNGLAAFARAIDIFAQHPVQLAHFTLDRGTARHSRQAVGRGLRAHQNGGHLVLANVQIAERRRRHILSRGAALVTGLGLGGGAGSEWTTRGATRTGSKAMAIKRQGTWDWLALPSGTGPLRPLS
jgi:hypothetical protein